MARKVDFRYLSIGRHRKEFKGYLYKGIVFRTKRDLAVYLDAEKKLNINVARSTKGRFARYALAAVEGSAAVTGVAAGQPASVLLFVPAAQLVVPEKYQRRVKSEIKSAKKRIKELI